MPRSPHSPPSPNSPPPSNSPPPQNNPPRGSSPPGPPPGQARAMPQGPPSPPGPPPGQARAMSLGPALQNNPFFLIQNYDTDGLRTLLDNRLDPNFIGRQGYSLLAFAVIYDIKFESFSNSNMTSLLLRYGADVNKISNDKLPIWHAVTSKEKHSFEMIKLLVMNGSKFDNLVARVAVKRQFVILRFLIAHGAGMRPILSEYKETNHKETKTKFQEIIKEYTPELKRVTLHKSKIPTEAFNLIMYMDENIDDFLKEDPQNKILKYGNTYTAINAKDMITNYLNDIERYKNTFYPCSKPGNSIIPVIETVDLFKPLFPLERVTQVSGFLLMHEIINALNSKNKFIEVLVNESTDIIANTSAQMLSVNPRAFSANHCQPGKSSKLYRLAFIDIKDSDSVSPEKREGRFCLPGQELNPASGRCRKVCREGTVRNEKGRCVKNATKKPATKKFPRCPKGTRRNKKTGHCEILL